MQEKCGTELISGLLQTEEETTILQMEKNLRTCVEVLQKQKRDRKQELKALQEQDRSLSDILCTPLFSIDTNSVPSLEDLDRYRRHVASLNTLKVSLEGEGVAEGPTRGPLAPDTALTSRNKGRRNLSATNVRSFCSWRSWTTPRTPALSGTWCVRMRKCSACPRTTSWPYRNCCSRYVVL